MNSKLVFGLVVLGILAIGGYLYTSSQPEVSADGIASIKVVPNQVSVYFVVETHNISQQNSQLENNRIRDSLTRKLIEAGFGEEQLVFSGFSSYPEYDWSNGNQRLIGYVTRQDLGLKLTNFSEVSTAVNAGISGGAYVSTISFELSQDAQNTNKIEALELASKDARSKAEAQARGLGRSLGRLVAVQSSEFNYYPVPYYARGGEGIATSAELDQAKDAAASIAPRELEVSAQVRVTYKLSLF